MKRSRSDRTTSLAADENQILRLTEGLANSNSRAEDAYWEHNLVAVLDELLSNENEEVLAGALESLYSDKPGQPDQQRNYDILADTLETCAEQTSSETGETLLIAAPLLAWSRFSIPAGTLPAETLTSLRAHLHAHVLAKDVKLGLADTLFSPDQLPQGYCATAQFTTKLAASAKTDGILQVDPGSLPETSRFLSDMRYILAAVHAPKGAPIFRWQETDGSRETAMKQWQTQGGALISPMLPGCAMELVLPDAFFAACRIADKSSRPYSIQASVAFLSTTLDVQPKDLQAVVAPFYDHQLEEFRIGFTASDSKAVVHGIVWPLLGPDDEASDARAQIDACLKSHGISNILHLDARFPLEYCDDCGAPMYPSPDGEAVHAELPEEKAEQIPKHLH